MELFSNKYAATRSLENKDEIFLNRICPFADKLCGNWCALFKDFTNSDNGNTVVILGCKANHENIELLPEFKKEGKW